MPRHRTLYTNDFQTCSRNDFTGEKPDPAFPGLGLGLGLEWQTLVTLTRLPVSNPNPIPIPNPNPNPNLNPNPDPDPNPNQARSPTPPSPMEGARPPSPSTPRRLGREWGTGLSAWAASGPGGRAGELRADCWRQLYCCYCPLGTAGGAA